MSLRKLLEMALRHVISKEPPFRLRRCAFKGDGMVRDYTHEELLHLTYGDVSAGQD
jgi:hypothetical protein